MNEIDKIKQYEAMETHLANAIRQVHASGGKMFLNAAGEPAENVFLWELYSTLPTFLKVPHATMFAMELEFVAAEHHMFDVGILYRRAGNEIRYLPVPDSNLSEYTVGIKIGQRLRKIALGETP